MDVFGRNHRPGDPGSAAFSGVPADCRNSHLGQLEQQEGKSLGLWSPCTAGTNLLANEKYTVADSEPLHFGSVRAGEPILTEAAEAMIMAHVMIPILEVGKPQPGALGNWARVTPLVSGVVG